MLGNMYNTLHIHTTGLFPNMRFDKKKKNVHENITWRKTVYNFGYYFARQRQNQIFQSNRIVLTVIELYGIFELPETVNSLTIF